MSIICTGEGIDSVRIHPKLATRVSLAGPKGPRLGRKGKIMEKRSNSRKTAASQPTDKEVRAYVYQQLNGMEGSIPQGSNFNIEIKNHRKGHTARIVLESELGRFSFEETSDNVFEAIQRSGERMKSQLVEIHRAMAEENGSIHFNESFKLH